MTSLRCSGKSRAVLLIMTVLRVSGIRRKNIILGKQIELVFPEFFVEESPWGYDADSAKNAERQEVPVTAHGKMGAGSDAHSRTRLSSGSGQAVIVILGLTRQAVTRIGLRTRSISFCCQLNFVSKILCNSAIKSTEVQISKLSSA